MRIFPTPPYRDVQELLDSSEGVMDGELQTTLRDIRRANIFGLGTWVVKRHLSRLLAGHPAGEQLRILDLATGSADIPEEICRWGSRRGLDVSFVAADISPAILKVARERIERAGLSDRVAFLACDAICPPFADGEFDYVICSLALHHLDLAQARETIRQMRRVGRRGFIINDVYRSQGAWYMAWALTRLTTGNRLTRHDGLASVHRAFTTAEVRRLSKEAGVPVSIYRHPFWRYAAVGGPEAFLDGRG